MTCLDRIFWDLKRTLLENPFILPSFSKHTECKVKYVSTDWLRHIFKMIMLNNVLKMWEDNALGSCYKNTRLPCRFF